MLFMQRFCWTGRKFLSLTLTIACTLISTTIATFAQSPIARSVDTSKQASVAVEAKMEQVSRSTEDLTERLQANCRSDACLSAAVSVREAVGRHRTLRSTGGIEGWQLRREIVSKLSILVHAYRDDYPEYAAEFQKYQWVEHVDEVRSRMATSPPIQSLTLVPSSPLSTEPILSPTQDGDDSFPMCAGGGCKHPWKFGICAATCVSAAFFCELGCAALVVAPPLIALCVATCLSGEWFCLDACDAGYCH